MIGGSNLTEPCQGGDKFMMECDVDDVAAHHDVVDVVTREVGEQRMENAGAVDVAALDRPRQVAEQPLARQIAHPRRKTGRNMRV